jgi:hypothetical protein
VIDAFADLPRFRTIGQDRFIACCPAHEDKNPSLTIRETGDKILIYCWAGCSVSDICSAIGITVADLFHDSNHYHYTPDPQLERWRAAEVKLERWRQVEIVRCAEALRGRDHIIHQIDAVVAAGFLTEDEVTNLLASEYEDYNTIEWRFEQLVRNENTLELWRESRRTI